jgi:hypothetical protein
MADCASFASAWSRFDDFVEARMERRLLPE